MIRLWPDGLTARFSLLLIAALLGVNLIAAWLLAREGSDFDRAMRIQGDAQRLHALVSALEAADADTARRLPGVSSTGFTRFSVDPLPLDLPGTQDLPQHERHLAAQLPGHQIRIQEGGPPPGDLPRAPLLLVSVRLAQGVHAGQWLNALAYPLPAQRAWVWKMGFFAPLAASVLGTLLVGLVHIRRMTRPLRLLARAARAAGDGDRSARVPERGALELREAAAAFNDMQRRIAGFDAERMRLLAAVGHDLRTPITGLRIRAELIDDAGQRADMIRMLDDMAVMAEGLLQAASGWAGAETQRPCDLNALLARLCGERGMAYAGGAAMTLALRPVALGRAIGNLLDNALRYAGDARVRLQPRSGGALIVIEDDGPGIPTALLPRITEPFVRAEDSRAALTGGTGLGLTIARDIIAAHGGSLRLSNRSQGGLRVEIRLPAATDAALDNHGLTKK